MKVKSTLITQSRLVERRLCKLSIGDIPIIKIVVLTRPFFDLVLMTHSSFSGDYKPVFCRSIF